MPPTRTHGPGSDTVGGNLQDHKKAIYAPRRVPAFWLLVVCTVYISCISCIFGTCFCISHDPIPSFVMQEKQKLLARFQSDQAKPHEDTKKELAPVSGVSVVADSNAEEARLRGVIAKHQHNQLETCLFPMALLSWLLFTEVFQRQPFSRI